MKASLFVLVVSTIARAVAATTTLANFPGAMIYAVQTDATGNIYVAGFQGNYVKANPFVAKLSPTGQTLYSTTLAGSSFGIAWAIAADSSGAAYVFGNTNSPDFPVTPGALQTTFQASFQGFVTKLDPAGNIVYSTFVGGASDVTPGLASAPGLDSILVDSAGDVMITGEAGTAFPPSPAPIVSNSGSFVLELDPAGAKILGAIGGIGGMIAMDAQGDIYVTGVQYSGQSAPISITPGAFQSEPTNVCDLLGAFSTCGYQYVAKVNPGLNQVLYATYLSGKYGATPAALFVDAQGDAFVAGTTNSPDYPTTPDALEPQYIAGAAPSESCFFIFNCVNLPPAAGYLSEVNPSGTALIYSSYFSGTQTDTIDFAASTPNEIYIGGSARSADLPGFAGYPQQCLPQMYQTRFDGAWDIGSSRVTPGKILAYDAFAGTLITSSGSDVIAVDPNVPQAAVACILDAADLQPVTAIAPGELLSLFGEFSTGSAVAPSPGQVSTSLNGITIDVNGVLSSLLYVGAEQINFQVPPGVAVGASAGISLVSSLSQISDSSTLPIVASNPTAFLNTTAPSLPLAACTLESEASLNGLLPVALNPDGTANTCLNPAAAGSAVSLFLNGLGVTSAPAITATPPLTVAAVSALPGAVSGAWQVSLEIPAGQTAGGVQVSLTADDTPVRDANLIVWVK